MTTPPSAISPGISVVVPVYRSAAILPELHRRLAAALSAIGEPYEIILVEDAGGDDAWTVIEGLAAADDHVRGFRMSRNYGQHNALLCGIREARHAVTVTLDDDLQNPPEEIATLLARLDDDIDVVYGTPEHEQHGFWRDMASRITKRALQSAMSAETASHVSAFRAFRTPIRDAFDRYRGGYVSIDVLLTWGTTRFTYVQVRHDARTVGQSNYTFRKLVTHALNMVTGFSTLPLQIASLIGFRFVEMVYHPRLGRLDGVEPPQHAIEVAVAGRDDVAAIAAIAETAFDTGRFLLDPRLPGELSRRRYATWVRTSVEAPSHEVLTFRVDGDLVGFFIVERRPEGDAYWHLTAIAPGWQGRGLGLSVWRTMLLRHRSEGVTAVETTISAHNVAAMNLYARLGFTFAAAQTTLHWIRGGAIAAAGSA